MTWRDHGLIFRVKDLLPWAVSHAHVPRAIELADRIRVFACFWDEAKRGRIGYVDVDKFSPTTILGYSPEPLLTDAPEGAFDGNGTVPLSIIRHGNQLYLYYVGWQLFAGKSDKRYRLLTGLAISDDEGAHFTRHGFGAVLPARSAEDCVRTAGYMLKENGKFRAWISTSNTLRTIGGKATPMYDLEYAESADGLSWPAAQQPVLRAEEGEILGYGPGTIWPQNGLYHGLFSVRSWDAQYHGIYHATSADGICWSELTLSGMGFAAAQTCDVQKEVTFPSLIPQEGRILMFYNGEGFGRDGLRLAIWQD